MILRAGVCRRSTFVIGPKIRRAPGRRRFPLPPISEALSALQRVVEQCLRRRPVSYATPCYLTSPRGGTLVDYGRLCDSRLSMSHSILHVAYILGQAKSCRQERLYLTAKPRPRLGPLTQLNEHYGGLPLGHGNVSGITSI